MLARNLFSIMWMAWALYWLVLSRNVKATTREEPRASRLAHVLPLLLAGFLLAAPRMPIAALDTRFLVYGPWQYWTGAALCAAGLLFSVWARRHIGRNWSGIVTLKQDHELITSGPYAIVRHPIYTGLLLAFVGTAVVRGDLRGVLAVIIAFAALWRKLRFEEGWMREQFGPAYTAYSARVAALVPFIL
ncbi:MAG TPA: isoprenylcysteine carboxylmethyltransferase family protein [Casimicrobiaceae bacterium]